MIMKTNLIPKKKLFFFIIIGIGILFRFYNLSWGAPYFFHPDERNIASAISQLQYPSQLNPHFFAYGSLPIYVIYFTGVLMNIITHFILHSGTKITTVGFEQAIIIGRFYSFLLSALLLPLVYKIGKKVGGNKVGIYALLFSVFSTGFIQYAHFATFEMWLTFFILSEVYLFIRFYETEKDTYIFFGGALLGFLLSIKITSVIILPICLSIIIIKSSLRFFKTKKNKFIYFEKTVFRAFLFLSITIFCTYLTSPYYWLDNSGFLNSMNYESSVATGKLPVFYTQAFIGSSPFIFQIFRVFPFLLNPFVSLLLPISLGITFLHVLRKKNINGIIVLIFFLLVFVSQLPLFVVWTRYYVPTLPFLYIILSFGIVLLIKHWKNHMFLAVPYFLLGVSFIYSLLYVKIVLFDQDSRVQAAVWAKKNISSKSHILTESYDLGIIPFNQNFRHITLFNFYDLDTDRAKMIELKNDMKTTEYIILPSQRILQSRITHPQLFPVSAAFYHQFFDTKKFRKIYQTPCDIFCYVLYNGDPIIFPEQTINIFDRPNVFIFKKIVNN